MSPQVSPAVAHLSLSCCLLRLTVPSWSALCLFSSRAARLLMAVMWASSTVTSFRYEYTSIYYTSCLWVTFKVLSF